MPIFFTKPDKSSGLISDVPNSNSIGGSTPFMLTVVCSAHGRIRPHSALGGPLLPPVTAANTLAPKSPETRLSQSKRNPPEYVEAPGDFPWVPKPGSDPTSGQHRPARAWQLAALRTQ